MRKRMRYIEDRIGPVAQKILVLLLGGLALGLTTNPKYLFRILNNMARDWKEINKRALHRAIKKLYQSRLIDTKDNEDGTTSIVLTQKGRNKALVYHIDTIKIPKMNKWDRKWRIVMFDIPERFKKARDALALSLKRMDFYRLQKSVFIHPFECQNEIDFIIEFWSVRPYVRTLLASHIDNEFHIKSEFGIY